MQRYQPPLDINRAHDIRRMEPCPCGGLGLREQMLKIDGKWWHGRCAIAEHGIDRVAQMPKESRSGLRLDDIGVDAMKCLLATSFVTPGTRLKSRDLTTWLNNLRKLDRRAHSSKRDHQIEAHWKMLPLDWVKECADAQTLRDMETLCARLQLKPHRGARGGTKWELANVYRLNRLAELQRQSTKGAGSKNHGVKLSRC